MDIGRSASRYADCLSELMGWCDTIDTDSAYLEPSERATFHDDAFLVFEWELLKVFVPVCAFRTDPLENEEEQSRNGKGFV